METFKHLGTIHFLFLILCFLPTAAMSQNQNVLAVNNGVQLTIADVDVYVKVVQFVIGEKLKPTEVVEIQNEAIREFNQDPKKYLEDIKQVGQMMNQIYKLTDPIKIAEGRLMFLGEFHKIAQSTPQKDWSSVLKIQNRYLKVLQYNAQNGLLLTNKDVDAFLNFIDFTRKLNSEALLTSAVKNEFRASLIENYLELSTEQQALFVVMPIIWQVVDGQWKKLSPQQQKQVIAQFKSQNNQGASQNNVATNQTSTPKTTNSGNKGNLTAQQKLLRKRMMYQMMSNMSRSRHLTTMNIIENIGGTGNYWTLSNNY